MEEIKKKDKHHGTNVNFEEQRQYRFIYTPQETK